MNYIGQSLVAIDNKSAYLSWDPVVDDDMDGYNVYISVGTPTNFKRANGPLLIVPEYMTAPLRRDLIYYFRVTSVDTTGNESPPSEPIEFRFSDYKADPKLRIVTRPRKVKIKAGAKTVASPLYPDFMTLLVWDDVYLTGRVDVTLKPNEQVVKTVTPNFITQFTLGG